MSRHRETKLQVDVFHNPNLHPNIVDTSKLITHKILGDEKYGETCTVKFRGAGGSFVPRKGSKIARRLGYRGAKMEEIYEKQSDFETAWISKFETQTVVRELRTPLVNNLSCNGYTLSVVQGT